MFCGLTMLIGISGKIGSGKDTLGGCLALYGYQNRKFASKLKQICSLLSGLPYEYFEKQDLKDTYISAFEITCREMLQQFGTDVCRNWKSDIWVQALFADYRMIDNWVITDVRFPNEADAIRHEGGVMIRLNALYAKKSVHLSETALDDYPRFDIIVDMNNYTLDEMPILASTIVELVQEPILETIRL